MRDIAVKKVSDNRTDKNSELMLVKRHNVRHHQFNSISRLSFNLSPVISAKNYSLNVCSSLKSRKIN